VDTNLQETLGRFKVCLAAQGEIGGSHLLDLSGVASYDWIRNVSFREPDASRPSRKVSLVFNHLEPDELALHLTFLEHKIMRRITVSFRVRFLEWGVYTVCLQTASYDLAKQLILFFLADFTLFS